MSEQQQRLLWPSGQPFDPRRCLFAPAPEKIGTVRMASSTLCESQIWRKAFSSFGLPFKHTLGYLGDSGLACFECDGNPNRITRKEVLVFSEAANLFSLHTTKTFEFLWKDPLDRLLFRYEDVLPSNVPPDHIIHLLKMAEEAWTHWLLESATDNLNRGGSLEFPVLGQGTLRLSRNALHWGSTNIRRDDLEHFRYNNQSIELVPSYQGEARGYKAIRIQRASTANAEALRKLLVHSLGLPPIQ